MFDTLKRSTEYQKIQGAWQPRAPRRCSACRRRAAPSCWPCWPRARAAACWWLLRARPRATRFAADLAAFGLPAAVFPPGILCCGPSKEPAGNTSTGAFSAGRPSGRAAESRVRPGRGLLQYTVPRAEFCANTLTLKPGVTIPLKDLEARLAAAGYHRRGQVEGPGQFSVRGGILDVYPPDAKAPAGPNSGATRSTPWPAFDLLSQRRDEPLKKLHISPAREVLFGDAAATAAALRSALGAQKGQRRAAMERAMQPDLEQLDAGVVPEALDKYLALRYPKPATLLDYFADPVLVLEDPAPSGRRRATAFRRGEELKGLYEEGMLCPGLDVLYEDLPFLLAAAQKKPRSAAKILPAPLPERTKDIVNAPASRAAALQRRGGRPGRGSGPAGETGLLCGAFWRARPAQRRPWPGIWRPEATLPPPRRTWCPARGDGGAARPYQCGRGISLCKVCPVHRPQGGGGGGKKARPQKDKTLSSLTDIAPGDYVVHQESRHRHVHRHPAAGGAGVVRTT